MLDSRKKACPNDMCEAHKKKAKFNVKDTYCKECGSELVFVCKRCGKEIVDEGPKHTLCPTCEAKADDDWEKAKERAKKVGAFVAAAGSLVVATVTNPEKAKELISKAIDMIPKR